MAYRVDMNEWVAIESTNTQNGFEIKKRVLVTIVSDVTASFMVNIYAIPIAASLGGGSPCP